MICIRYLNSNHFNFCTLDQQSQVQHGAVNSQSAVANTPNEVVGEDFTVPTQAVDDDATELAQLLQGVKEQIQYLWSQKDKMDSTTYMSNLQQLEEKELQYEMGIRQQLHIKSQDTINTLQYINQLEFKCASLAKQVETLTAKLRDREDTVNQVSSCCKCDSNHLCHQLREQNEGLRQQLLKYEHMHLLDREQLEKLRAYVLNPSCLSGVRYSMSKTPHGITVIINNCKFHSATPTGKLLPNSRGTKGDIKNLRATWEHLHYDVRILSDLTASELMSHLRCVASESHENYDSFVCCILSYGCQDGVYGSDGEIVKFCDILTPFQHSHTLVNKPKLFFMYTCSADKEAAAAATVAPACEVTRYHCLPIETDFLFCSITMSWRSRSNYITVFHEVTKKYATQEHLLRLLCIINYKMFETKHHQGGERVYHGCCPAFSVTPLHKEVWFFTRQLTSNK